MLAALELVFDVTSSSYFVFIDVHSFCWFAHFFRSQPAGLTFTESPPAPDNSGCNVAILPVDVTTDEN